MLNSVNIYMLHSEIFEYTFCTLNNNICYTLHPNVKFAVNLDENSIKGAKCNYEYSLWW